MALPEEMPDKDVENSVDPDQTALQEQSFLGLHCLQKPVCPKTEDHYGNLLIRVVLVFSSLHDCEGS